MQTDVLTLLCVTGCQKLVNDSDSDTEVQMEEEEKVVLVFR